MEEKLMNIASKIPAWLWQPNVPVTRKIYFGLIVFWLAAFLSLWTLGTSELIPKPLEVVAAFPELFRQGLTYELTASYLLNVKALALSTMFSLGFAYLSRFSIGKPVAVAAGAMRFLGMTGLTFLFTVILGGGETLKLAMLTFGITVFYTTGMMAEVESIPLESYDHARTLRMSEWKVLREVVIYGTIDKAFELLRQNAAMGWMMLAMVEGTVRSGGGIGTMLLNQDKHFNLALVFAIQIIILLVGLFQDYGIDWLKRSFCPWVSLETGRK